MLLNFTAPLYSHSRGAFSQSGGQGVALDTESSANMLLRLIRLIG